MKPAFFILLLLICNKCLFSQYYLKGEVRDESGRHLSNVRILLHSTGYIYYSGSSGGFGIMSSRQADSVTLFLEGYQSHTINLHYDRYERINLKLTRTSVNLQKKRLISFTKDMKLDDRVNWSTGGETYSNLLENDFIEAGKFPETGFAISIDKASYSNVRRFIRLNSKVPPDAVRIEEMLNYFNLEYVPPPKDSIFGFDSRITACPWNMENNLMFLKICAKKVEMDSIPPSNLVFLVDVSGSMDMPNRLPLLKSAFKLLVNNLRAQDTVSIVVYGSAVGIWMPPTSGKEKVKIIKAIEDMNPGGSTAGASGINIAYGLAKKVFIPGGNNRVILATDGDFNVGQSSEEDLEKMISGFRQSGIYLTCLGVGMGNYKDSKLELLSKKGNGNFAYLDSEKEAEKVLVKELTQTMYSVADDAYCLVRFNPGVAGRYRLIGFDNKVNVVADSSSELEGGEVGSGHTFLAVIEYTPVKSDGTGPQLSPAKIMINYKQPVDSVSRLSVYECPPSFTEYARLDSCYRFATALVMFASMLKKSKYTKTLTWNEVIKMARSSYDEKDPLHIELIELMEKAKKIHGRPARGRFVPVL